MIQAEVIPPESTRMILIPDTFATYTLQRAGGAGRAWIERLPPLFETLCQRWDLVLDGSPMYGGLSLVIPVRRGDVGYV